MMQLMHKHLLINFGKAANLCGLLLSMIRWYSFCNTTNNQLESQNRKLKGFECTSSLFENVLLFIQFERTHITGVEFMGVFILMIFLLAQTHAAKHMYK